MDQLIEEKSVDTVSRLTDMNKLLDIAASFEAKLQEFRDVYGKSIHPWATFPLKDAVGSIQSCRSHLRTVKDLVNPPGQVIDAEFQVVADSK